MADALTLLCLDPDPAHARGLSQSFSRAGFAFRLVPDARRVLHALKTAPPDVLLVHAEPPSPMVREVLEALVGEPAAARLPVVLLAADAAATPFVGQFRSGLVEILKKPFSPTTHPDRVLALLRELEQRKGVVQGTNVQRILEHVQSTFRTGELQVNPETSWPSTASFLRGQLASARHLGAVGAEALEALQALTSSPWRFTELSGADGDGLGVVVELAGEEDAGEEITVEPLADDEPSEGVGEVQEEPTHPSGRPDPIPMLLVDDDPELCRMFRLLFERHGYAVTTAEDGELGVEAALQKEHALVVADLNMPRLDGWGLLRRLREDYRTRELPFAMLSCQDDYRESLKAMDAGAQAYFSKSTRLEQLALKVKSLLEPRRRFRDALRAGQVGSFSPQELGPQWVLRELARAQINGTLETSDSFARYRVVLVRGDLAEISAHSGGHRAGGERALNAFVASQCAEGTLTLGMTPARALEPVGPALERASQVLNDNAHRLRETLLVKAGSVRVNEDLYRIYQHNGPKPWLETARLLCEEKLPPREVILRVGESPLEVEEALRDLVRRGVVTLEL